jgi:hypothetical protein
MRDGVKKSSPHVKRFISEVLAIEAEDAEQAGRLAYIARALVMATLPHSKPEGAVFQRKNGCYTLTMTAAPEYGLPYGSIPRLLFAWMTTEAVKRKSPVLELGKSQAAFLQMLDLSNQGGKRGDIKRLREQMLRLFTTHVACRYHDEKSGMASAEQFLIARSFNLWWSPVATESGKLLPHSCITLAKDFFDELIDWPIPIDFRVLQALRRSPLQIDIYIWLTYRFSYLKAETIIPWLLLKMQFGSDYADDAHGLRNFRGKFLAALKAVLFIYKAARVETNQDGVRLLQSKTHIKKSSQAGDKTA